jgi:cytochrome c oxidase cbb3-type subunit IV
MDINSLRSIVTLASFILFIGIVIWALRPRNGARFAQAAQLPFVAEGERPHE